MNGATNRKFWNFLEYKFKGNYNRCCNFPNCYATSLNNNIMSNSWGELQVLSNSNFKYCSTKSKEVK